MRDAYDALRFHLLPPPRNPDIARLVGQIARGIHKLVDRHFQDDEQDQNTDVLAHEQRAAITTTSRRVQLTTAPTAGNCAAFVAGYSLQARRVIDGDDRSALERLCRYGARAPIANSRLARSPGSPDGQVVITLRKPLRDGRTELRFSPLEFLRRLATLIPPPRTNLTHYHGVFAPNHHLRAAVVAFGRVTDAERPILNTQKQPKRRRLDWASLLRRVFAIDILRWRQSHAHLGRHSPRRCNSSYPRTPPHTHRSAATTLLGSATALLTSLGYLSNHAIP